MEARDGDADFNQVPDFVTAVTNLYDDQKF